MRLFGFGTRQRFNRAEPERSAAMESEPEYIPYPPMFPGSTSNKVAQSEPQDVQESSSPANDYLDVPALTYIRHERRRRGIAFWFRTGWQRFTSAFAAFRRNRDSGDS